MKFVLAITVALLAAGACILADVSARREVEYSFNDSIAEYTGIASVAAWLVLCACLAFMLMI